MHTSVSTDRSISKKWIGLFLFAVIFAIGLYWAKWNPYYHKALLASKEHNIGSSLLEGMQNGSFTEVIHSAWNYSITYFLAIWKALLVATVAASLMQVLVPREWLNRVLGKTGFLGTVSGGLLSLPSMMCTCCAAPVVSGLRKCSSSVGSAIAFWFGNTALNPAVLIFMAFVLGWKFTILRLILGVILVFGVSYLANRINKDNLTDPGILEKLNSNETSKNKPLLVRWIVAFSKILVTILPLYIVSVFVMGLIISWLYPILNSHGMDSFWLIIAFAIIGTLFVIPTAAEIAIIQAVLSVGIGHGPAAALLITLPVISVPSIIMVRKAFSKRTLAFLAVSVMVLGIVAGCIGSILF
ncbi:permease [Bacillus sp. FJAT-49736]|uniref:permease n=1 Tax=Bacillus sp. FJAT-49736 TaxID=2833582 RepID=UPI001BC988A7|nr:permease [Bacillus sp. FJAT-49736]MBS4172973.1 permease [Bacillus sp. FJAT-49736]